MQFFSFFFPPTADFPTPTIILEFLTEKDAFEGLFFYEIFPSRWQGAPAKFVGVYITEKFRFYVSWDNI